MTEKRKTAINVRADQRREEEEKTETHTKLQHEAINNNEQVEMNNKVH